MLDYIQSKQLVGVSAGVLKDNNIVWQNAYGYLDVNREILADSNMLHRIASVTKPMTSVAILQLVEKNILALDLPIQTYLPNYPRKKEGDITIRQLLNHTSGTPAYKFFTSENRPTTQYANLEEAVKVFQDRALLNIPGQELYYSSYGYTVLGAIIEKVTGQSYQDYMQENIWSKCGMTNTSIEVFNKDYSNKAKLYEKNWLGFTKAQNTNLSIKYPAGGVQSTVGDMLRFAKAMNDNTLISTESKAKAFEIPKLTTQPHIKYGLGWILEDDDKYGFIHYHDGHQSGTSTEFIVVPSKNMAIMVMANASNSNDKTREIAWQLLDIYSNE